MPISQRNGKWYWGSKGPFDSRQKAEEVAQAAHASGFVGKFMEFMKENGGGDGGGGGAFMSADVGTPTYGSNRKKKKKRSRKLKKTDDLMFVSTVDADEAFKNDKERLKTKTGVERADKFLNEFSPEMKAIDEDDNNFRKRRKLNNTSMGTSSSTTVNTPTHSHATTFNKSLVIDLLKWVTVELRKDGDPYGVRRLDNEVPTRPYHKDEQPYKKKKGGTPTAENSVPSVPNPNAGMKNMGLAGGLENSRGQGPPGPFDPWSSNNADVPDAGTPSKLKKPIKSQYQQVSVSGPNASGNNVQAMEKGSLAAGGSPHMLTMVQPRHGSEENPQYVEKKGEIDLEADIKQNEIMDRAKEKRKRDKDRIETSQEPPLDGVTGAMANAVDNPIGLGLMEKTEFGNVPDDALHRGGDLDIIDDEDEETLPEDKDLIQSEEVEKEMRKLVQKNISAWFAKGDR